MFVMGCTCLRLWRIHHIYVSIRNARDGSIEFWHKSHTRIHERMVRERHAGVSTCTCERTDLQKSYLASEITFHFPPTSMAPVPSFTWTKSHICHCDQQGHGPEQRHQGVENTYLKEDIRREEKVAFTLVILLNITPIKESIKQSVNQSNKQLNKLYVKDNMNFRGWTPIAKLSKYKPYTTWAS